MSINWRQFSDIVKKYLKDNHIKEDVVITLIDITDDFDEEDVHIIGNNDGITIW